MSAFDLTYILNKYNIIPNGVIHIGAHKGEEKEIYNLHNIKNIVWIEANPDLIDCLKENVNDDIVINEAISNNEELCIFNITSHAEYIDNHQSSSLKELDYHLI